MVDYPIGELIAERVRAMGVTPFYKRFAHDGARGPNMATVYSDRGLRHPCAGRFLQPQQRGGGAAETGRLRVERDLRRGVRWFHSGGIFASLSETTPELIVEAMQAARDHGAVVSFDLNYREKLWRASPGGAARARQVLSNIVEHVDVLVGNEEDLQAGLGIPGPAAASKTALDPERVLSMIERW